MHTIWIVPGRFGLTFGPQQTGSLKEYGMAKTAKTILRKIWSNLVKWNQRSRQRTDLADLSDDLLKDIGLTHEARRLETAKKFWEI